MIKTSEDASPRSSLSGCSGGQVEPLSPVGGPHIHRALNHNTPPGGGSVLWPGPPPGFKDFKFYEDDLCLDDQVGLYFLKGP